MNIGLAVTTYAGKNTDPRRLDIIKTCLNSVRDVPVRKIIIKDGFENDDHYDLIRRYRNDFNVIVQSHSGIANAKNACIDKLKNCDYIFLLDDDILIKDPLFFADYIRAINKTEIQHFSFMPRYAPPVTTTDINGVICEIFDHLSGCMMVLTKKVVETIGYFKVLPNKYGHEHTNYTQRCTYAGLSQNYIDIAESVNTIELINEGNEIKSGIPIIQSELDENAIHAQLNINELYIPYK